MNIITNEADFVSFIKDQVMNNGNLSIRGVARCCGVHDHKSIVVAGDFKSKKLAQSMLQHGFQAGDLIENGFSPEAVWLTIEYFAFDSKAKAPMAKQLARTFGSFGIKQFLGKLKEVPQQPERQLPPKRDTIDWLNASDRIQKLNDPILKSYLTQSLYEDLGAKVLPQGVDDRKAPIAVRARELGYNLKQGQDSQLGKYAVKHIAPVGTAPHGRYEVNIYEINDRTDEVIHSYFR